MSYKLILHTLGVQLMLSSALLGQDSTIYDTPTPLGSSVNSSAEETMPLIAEQGKTLYFVRTFHAENKGGEMDQDIWVSNLEGENWSTPSNNASGLNNDKSNMIVGLSADGQRAYVMNNYSLKKEHMKGLAVVNRSGNGWGRPAQVMIPGLKITDPFCGFYVSPKEDVVLISYNNGQGAGQEDLYVSLKGTDGNWSSPIALGSTINTPGYEISPYLASDGTTLYFSSSAHGAQGACDIFRTRRLDDSWTNWSPVERMKAPINSDKFDAYFTIYPDSTIYFASNRDQGRSDLYRTRILKPVPPPDPVYTVQGRITDSETGEAVPAARYRLMDSDSKELLEMEDDQELGRYLATLSEATSYTLEVSAEGYLAQEVSFATPISEEDWDIEKNLALDRLKVGTEIRLNNIYFEYAKADLKDESIEELSRVVKMLNDNPKIRIEIGGHTDSKGSSRDNQKLSEARARSVVDFLIANGIEAKRMEWKGYGESQLIHSDAEIAKAATGQEKDSLHQENRRTVLKILE